MRSSETDPRLNGPIATGAAYAPRRDPRAAMAFTFAAAMASGAAGVAIYATLNDRWDAGATAFVCGTALSALYSALTPWTRPARTWQLAGYWLTVLAVTASVYVLHAPALGLLMLMPMVMLAYCFGRDHWIVAGNLLLAVAAFLLPVITGEADDAASSLIITLPAIVAVAALAAVLADRFDAIRERERGGHKATIEALSTALTACDGYTGHHSQETLCYVRGVCEEFVLSADAGEYVADVAVLHDIGKIGIPNEILHAPGKLDERQWEVMKQHPVIGERIVATVPGLEEVARAIRHEHERWDGGGYPDGLRQGEIPLASRIVLACDALHAMTSDRPYRPAMTLGQARMELARNAGTQFDPTVVGALLQLLDRRSPERASPVAAFDDVGELVVQQA